MNQLVLGNTDSDLRHLRQNVWPILYKPLFHPTQTHPVLLSAMLATASVVAVQSSAAPAIDAEALFLQAKDLLQRHRDESRMYVVQALFLLALAQTGRGNKGSAYIYAGQACAMALEMGLHRCSTGLKKLSHVRDKLLDLLLVLMRNSRWGSHSGGGRISLTSFLVLLRD